MSDGPTSILIACDTFKDALPAPDVCQAIEAGLRLANPGFETTVFPLSDGGEGTSEILQYHLGGSFRQIDVRDPLFRTIRAKYLIAEEEGTACIEMAHAAGLQLLDIRERSPLRTTTFGVGEMISEALDKGARKILLGLGGSATNDGGMGMAAALGWRFLDGKGSELKPIGNNLGKIREIDGSGARPHDTCTFEILCDVENPLLGDHGAARTYAAQKGASPEEVEMLEEGMRHFAGLLEKHTGKSLADVPGAGAAGGMGAGALAFLNATLSKGIDIVMQRTAFENAVQHSDVIITGEGRLDAQTGSGKVISGVCRMAAKYDIPVIALCGKVDASPAALEDLGLLGAVSIEQKSRSLEEALAATREDLHYMAFQLGRMVLRTEEAG